MASDLMGDVDAILGGDDTYGEDLSGADIAGVARYDPVLAAKMRKAALAAKVQPAMVPGRALRSREMILGFDSQTDVAASTDRDITSRPQVIFRPERIIVGATIAQFFAVRDFRVGKDSQFTAAGAVPADVFAPTSVGVRLKMDTAQPAMDVVFSVSNIDTVNPHRFLGAVIGSAVD
jgi:hypothetical protein